MKETSGGPDPASLAAGEPGQLVGIIIQQDPCGARRLLEPERQQQEDARDAQEGDQAYLSGGWTPLRRPLPPLGEGEGIEGPHPQRNTLRPTKPLGRHPHPHT